MNITIIVLAILIALAFIASILSIIRNYRSGCSNCGGCPYNSSCVNAHKVFKKRDEIKAQMFHDKRGWMIK
ncbi:MAG: FeoB-associated Cys-rich membrane protein [Clostridiales bacterium]|nr:FeoB-associated Cys-rich membrane protein [Clostridiales bacterium]